MNASRKQEIGVGILVLVAAVLLAIMSIQQALDSMGMHDSSAGAAILLWAFFLRMITTPLYE